MTTEPELTEVIRDNGKFVAGYSGNPLGRPKESLSLVSLLKRQLRLHPEDAQSIINGLVTLGQKPNPQQLGAIRELLDRVDGKVVERHRIEGELPVKIVFVPALELLGREQDTGHDERPPGGNLDVVDGDYEVLPQSETGSTDCEG